MRIRNIRVNRWRHFENVELTIDDNIGLVCIVGANGTGKSHLLELIAACANQLGLSRGIDIPRGDPFSDSHDFSLQFYLAAGVSNDIDRGLASEASFKYWDRTLTITSQKNPQRESLLIMAGGITEPQAARLFASRVVAALRESKTVYFLSLDGNRAYPKKAFNANEMAQAYETDWSGLEFTRGRSFKPTPTLYDEWIKYFLAQENQAGTRHMQGIRRARQSNNIEPTFIDHFDAYKQAVQKVLPHIIFTGVDSKKRTLLFDTTGLELSFDQLSGGEREIAFLIGQIDRFKLHDGLFLLDEPELHLNADLIRTWVAYLTSTIQTGQIWLATHSLEAVEAAGTQATFVLERNEETRKVDRLARLDTRPILSALSRAVGTPAFSISKLRFIFVEGEEGIGERERFRNLAGLPQDIRFIESGSCNDVLRRIETIKALTNEAEARIRVGGIIDRDFRSDAEVKALESEYGVFVLPVHEVENFFLHPETLQLLLSQNGIHDVISLDLIRDMSDARAGSWIFQYIMATRNAKSMSDISQSAKEYAKALSWKNFEENRETTIRTIVERTGYEAQEQETMKRLMDIGAKAYERYRSEPTFWKVCEGKQVLNAIPNNIGFNATITMMQAEFAAWSRDQTLISNLSFG